MDTGSIDVAGPQLAQAAVPNDSLGPDGAEDYPRMHEFGAGMVVESQVTTTGSLFRVSP